MTLSRHAKQFLGIKLNFTPTRSTPRSLEMIPEGTKLYVPTTWPILDVASQKAEKSVPVVRLPWGVAVML